MLARALNIDKKESEMQSIQVNSVQLCKYTTTFSNEIYNMVMLYTVGKAQSVFSDMSVMEIVYEKEICVYSSELSELGYKKSGRRNEEMTFRLSASSAQFKFCMCMHV